MNILDKLKILSYENTLINSIQRGINMKSATVIIGSIITFLTAILQMPTVQHIAVTFVNTHPAVSLALGGISTLAALVHNPSNNS